jgi:hypothetical protein
VGHPFGGRRRGTPLSARGLSRAAWATRELVEVVVYHEVRPESLGEVLHNGLKRGDQGEKSDAAVRRADDCLQTRIPHSLADSGVSRQWVVYGYLSAGDKLIDIRHGDAVDVERFASERELVVLRVRADLASCFVSDLDAYDAVKTCVETDADDALLAQLADRYWARVLPLEEYRPGRYRRPEVMVTHDIAPEDIEVRQ